MTVHRLCLFKRSSRAVLVLLAMTPACGDDDCSDEIEAARAFLGANRSCQVNEDCVVVSTGCHTFGNGVCGQAPLERTAAESAEWARLQHDLGSCKRECAQCAAALAPT
ncbi:MAG TPA: hypothetical protein VI072_19425, partial [Polyangiaceae bacterium]